MRVRLMLMTILLALAVEVHAQESTSCPVICKPELSVQPTATVNNVFAPARITAQDGILQRQKRGPEFDMLVAVDLATRLSWLNFAIESSVAPFQSDNNPELEFEAEVTWLTADRTGGWISAHADVVDTFSPAGRPTDRRAYTHKLDFEAAVELAVFNWLPQTRWLQSVHVEVGLDYLASGLARRGDVVDGVTFVDNASPWSLSVAVILPIGSQ